MDLNNDLQIVHNCILLHEELNVSPDSIHDFHDVLISEINDSEPRLRDDFHVLSVEVKVSVKFSYLNKLVLKHVDSRDQLVGHYKVPVGVALEPEHHIFGDYRLQMLSLIEYHRLQRVDPSITESIAVEWLKDESVRIMELQKMLAWRTWARSSSLKFLTKFTNQVIEKLSFLIFLDFEVCIDKIQAILFVPRQEILEA